MADSTSKVTIQFNTVGDFDAFVTAREHADALKSSIDGVKSVLESLGASFSIAGVAAFSSALIAAGAATSQLADQAHISTDAFQTLSYAALDSGLKSQDLANKLEYLNKSMGLAAGGASKQNEAISDLGLDTATLLAMPVEGQLEAIAKAYVNSTNKAQAYADVVVLLGKGTAQLQGVLEKLGTKGYAGIDADVPWKVSAGDLARLESLRSTWDKIKQTITGVFMTGMSHMGEGFNPAAGFMNAVLGTKAPSTTPESVGVAPTAPGAAPAPAAVAAQRQAIRDAIADSPEMIAAQEKLTEALQDQSAAYEDLDTKAARLRSEAKSEMTQAAALAKAHENDAAVQVKAIDMLTDATKKLGAANAAEAAADKQYISDTNKIDDEEYREQVKIGEAKVKSLGAQFQAQQKLMAVAEASVEHDWNLTDTQKWEEKKALLEENVAELEAYIQKQNEIANNPLLPTEVSGQARTASAGASRQLTGAQGQLAGMGPDPNSMTQNLSANLTKLQSQWGTLEQNMASGLTNVIGTAVTTISDNLTKVISGTETWRKALLNIAQSIESSVISAFIQMGVRWVATQLMMAVEGKAIAASSTAAMIPLAMAESEIWAAPAALATIASWGGAAVAAPALVLASMTATQGLALASEGGFFPGDPAAARGIFHGDEYVFSAPAVRNIGADNLERMHQAAKRSGAEGSSVGGLAASAGGDSHHFYLYTDLNEAARQFSRNPSVKKSLINSLSGRVRSV